MDRVVDRVAESQLIHARRPVHQRSTIENMKLHKYLILVVLVAGLFFLHEKTAENEINEAMEANLLVTEKGMQITSSAFGQNADMPSKYSCEGIGVSPPLSFANIPEETVSLALVLHDPDAPREGGFTHWVIFNMAPTMTGIAENSNPSSGIQGSNGTGSTGYRAVCPPTGKHHYIFTLYALDTVLDLDSSATKETLDSAMEGHILEQAELVGMYQK